MEHASCTQRHLTADLKAAVRQAFDSLRTNLPGFRARASQNAMVAAAAKALGTSGGRAVIEGPTGTGKSLAYLLAGVPVAIAAKRKLVISSATIQLQEQLANRDIPAFLAATGLKANLQIGKGRQRYACPRNISELVSGQGQPAQADLHGFEPAGWPKPPQPEDVATVETLAEALFDESWDGDLDNAPSTVKEQLRPLLTSSSSACSGRRCVYAQSCPALKARDRLKDADIIVANHDLVLRSLLLHQDGDPDVQNFLADPAQTIYVFDEAHNLADKAIDAGSAALHLPSAIGRMPKLKAAIAGAFRALGQSSVMGRQLQEVHGRVDEINRALDELRQQILLSWQPRPTDREPSFRAPLGVLPDAWRETAARAQSPAAELANWLAAAKQEVGAADLAPRARDRATRELGIASEFATSMLALASLWGERDAEGPPAARWVTLGADQGHVCHASPISAASILKHCLWDAADAVVLTSATLSAGGDFGELAELTGIPANAEYLSLPSPFNLAEQATLTVPRFPSMPDSDTFPADVARWMEGTLDWSAGSLVLFTSKRQMQATIESLNEPYRAAVRAQGDAPKQVLLDGHAKAVRDGVGSVLCGLVSFGEGLDLSGDLATHVVIPRLPFAVPTDPVEATRTEWFEACGRNPFMEISVPGALRTLTQWCGRLIRTETDHGDITILDRRIVTKRYGQTLLAGLPPFRKVIAR